jgi:hypothetical protein
VRFRIEQQVAAPLPVVEEAFVDPDLLKRLADLPKLAGAELVSREDDGTLVHLRIRYRFTGELNAAVRAVIDPSRLTWVEDSIHDRRTHRGTFRILPDHYSDRLSCSGTVRLEAEGSRATLRWAEGDLSVRKVFLVGRAVETAIINGMAEHARVQAELVQKWIGETERSG